MCLTCDLSLSFPSYHLSPLIGLPEPSAGFSLRVPERSNNRNLFLSDTFLAKYPIPKFVKLHSPVVECGLTPIACLHVRKNRSLLYVLSYFLGRVLLDKLTRFNIVKKVPAFYGTRRLITGFKRAPTCPYSEPDQSSPCSPSHFLKIHINIVFPSTPEPSKWCLFTRFPRQSSVSNSSLPHTLYIPHPSHSS